MSNASSPEVPKVTTIPSVAKDTWSKRILEKNTIKKKIVIANMPAPTGGDAGNGTRRLNP
ncbi:hypothetical protein SBF1_1030016 [Candidatus Desulfosporosinus infrequens]|uniref:Uncharacterized protein n=1 Tax=Candidatus Desulfosporosinus infrequens TaxID=2043169 RepID=A0A2U3JWE9_9FIRM|nr:hypothetical protein SBF1_1030016 [Candidatus Desulfosporosinus infrequens]